MLVVGLTGGIGSGKSTVAKLFKEKGIPIIDADEIARQVIQPPEPAFKKIITHFGEHILAKDGSIDRVKLRKIIFENEDERKWLENLLHPIIRTCIEQQIKLFSASYCIVIIPLLFETESYSFINRIVVIDAPEHIQIERVMARDLSNQDQVTNILKTQVTREVRLKGAHDIILNAGPITDLPPQIEKLHKLYSELGSLS